MPVEARNPQEIMTMTTTEPNIRARKIAIKPCRYWRHSDDVFSWRKSPAFAVNVRGILIHRVKHVVTILWHGKESHYHVGYLCGNGCNVDLDNIEETLVADPPRNRLLCENCELRAKREKLPSGDKLAKRHVHRGILVPQQTCCQH